MKVAILFLLVIPHVQASPSIDQQPQIVAAAQAVNADSTDSALQAELLAALLAWHQANQPWTVAEGDDIQVVGGLLRCQQCRKNKIGRVALLRIAEALRQGAQEQLHLTYAYEIARQCGPTRPGDPFKPSKADDVRLLRLQFAELEAVNRRTLSLLSQAGHALDNMSAEDALKLIDQLARQPGPPTQSKEAEALQALIGFQLPSGLPKLREARKVYLSGAPR